MDSPETAKVITDSRSRTAVLKLDSPESVTYPQIQIFEYLRSLCQPEVGLPAPKVYPHLSGNLGYALASNTSGDEPDAPFERSEQHQS